MLSSEVKQQIEDYANCMDIPEQAVALFNKYAAIYVVKRINYPNHPEKWYVEEDGHRIPFSKEAAELSPVMDALGSIQKPLGGPNPLTLSLLLGALGTAGGYAGGALAEQFLPESQFEHGVLRKRTALLGGLAGLAPGVAWGAANMAGWPGKEKADELHIQPNPNHGLSGLMGRYPFNPEIEPEPVQSHEFKNTVAGGLTHAFQTALLGKQGSAEIPPVGSLASFLAASKQADIIDEYEPGPGSIASSTGLSYVPNVNVEKWKRVVTTDPFLPPQAAAVAIGIPMAAAAARGSNEVSVSDIVSTAFRAAAGGLIGGISGEAFGQIVGVVTGLKPSAISQLQTTGLIAGALRSTMPGLF